MSGEPLRLDDLLGSVADGSPVDWDAASISVRERDRRLLRHLRVVAEVAQVHRTIPSDEPVATTKAPLMDLVAPGQSFARWGHLLLIERVGQGAFGDVYRARDPWLDREVALKLLRADAASRILPTRLVDEARALARVRHPNVVTVHGADRHDGQVGLWMEFVQGRTLAQIVAAQGPLSAAEAAVAGQEICRALSAVHAAGLVHGDVKAQNVMRESGGRLVLMDFGAGHTPLYLAPELLPGGGATVGGDIYAVGVLLYYLVTGRYPMKGMSVADLEKAHAEGGYRRLGEMRPDLPEGFVKVVERALHPSPGQRYPSARAVHDALGESVATTDARSPALPSAPPVGGGPARTKAIGAGLAGAIALVVATLVWSARNADRQALPSGPVRTLAVLPFEDMSADSQERYLGQAVPYELSARLAHIGALRVVPWTLSKGFARNAASLRDLHRRTGADAVVAGAVQVAPGGPDGRRPVRVHVQMFEAGSGTMLWDAVFERDLGDFFALQAEIAEDVARRINVVLLQRERTLVAQTRRVDPRAMEVYLKARQAFETYADGFRQAVDLYQEAIRLDARFAEAHVGLAGAYSLQAAYGGIVATDAAIRRATSSLETALAIDPQLAEAWSARAFVRLALSWDWEGAEADFARALELNPSSSAVRSDYSNYLTIVGDHAAAIAEARKAEERDPYSPVFGRKVAWAYYHSRRYDDAIVQLQKLLDLSPGYVPARTLLARAYTQIGRHREAVAELESVRSADGIDALLAHAYAAAGRAEDARTLLSDLQTRGDDAPRHPYSIALAYAALGDRASMVSWLRRAYEERDPNMAHVAVDPALDAVRSDAAVQDFLRRMRLNLDRRQALP